MIRTPQQLFHIRNNAGDSIESIMQAYGDVTNKYGMDAADRWYEGECQSCRHPSEAHDEATERCFFGPGTYVSLCRLEDQ